MKDKIAEIPLTVEEMGEALAKHISHTRLTPAHFWNSYTLEIKIHNGELAGATVRYYLDEEGQKAVNEQAGRIHA